MRSRESRYKRFWLTVDRAVLIMSVNVVVENDCLSD